MRIGILTQYYPPEIGAPQARLAELAGRMARRGHEIFVLTAMPNYPAGKIHPGYGGVLRRETRDGVSVTHSFIYPYKGLRRGKRLLNYLSFAFSSLITGALLLPRVDYLITETPPPFLEIPGCLLARMKGARWILNVSDLWLDSLKNFGVLREEGFVYRALRRTDSFTCRKAWMVSGQSREIVAEIARRNPAVRVHHLSNGVNPRVFHPYKRDEMIRRRYLQPGETGFVFAGLHGYFQGLDQILRAADRLQEVPVRFLFLGDGPEKEALIRRAGELKLRNVDFYPPLPHPQVAWMLASMDVALVSLRARIPGSVPSKIYEAMGCGVPILLVAAGEAAEIVQKAGAGVIMAPGNIPELAEKIRELAARPEWRHEMGKRGREAAIHSYDRAKIIERFEEALRDGEAGPAKANAPLPTWQTEDTLWREKEQAAG